MNLLQKLEQKYLASLTKDKEVVEFKAGCRLKVKIRVPTSGGNYLTQYFEGLCIARTNKGVRSNFTVRRIGANSVGIEKKFQLHSPAILSIEVLKRGRVRRAKLYYMRNLTGKAARIPEIRVNRTEIKQGAKSEVKVATNNDNKKQVEEQ